MFCSSSFWFPLPHPAHFSRQTRLFYLVSKGIGVTKNGYLHFRFPAGTLLIVLPLNSHPTVGHSTQWEGVHMHCKRERWTSGCTNICTVSVGAAAGDVLLRGIFARFRPKCVFSGRISTVRLVGARTFSPTLTPCCLLSS